MASSPERVSKAISDYSPPGLPETVVVFARTCVALVSPASVDRAKALLFATSRLGAFAHTVGIELTASLVFSPSVIERFCCAGVSAMAPATRRSIRSNLRHMARQLEVGPVLVAAPLGRERAKLPYSPAELAHYLALVDAQPTRARAMRGSALLALGAGAGLTGADLRAVRGADIVARSGGVVVEVNGSRPRVVPVRAEWCARALQAADFAGESLVVGGQGRERRNVTSGLTAALGATTDLAPLEISRLRSTWLSACAADLGLATFLAAAGITCSQRLGDLVAGIAVHPEPEAVRLLGGLL